MEILVLIRANLSQVAMLAAQETVDQEQPVIQGAVSRLESKIPDLHNQALSRHFQSDEPSSREREYAQLQWSLASFAHGSLILGDVGILEFDPVSGQFFSGGTCRSPERAVFLPLSDDLLVKGSSPAKPAVVSASDLNLASSRLSTDFFISCLDTEMEANLHGEIGKIAFNPLLAELEDAMRDLAREYRNGELP